MSEHEKSQICQMISKSPRSVWGYWPFIFPILVLLIGIAVQVVLLAYFRNQVPALEVCIRLGKQVEPLWDSQLVKEAVLTLSLSITVTFGLLAFLAHRAHRQIRLLRFAARELGILPYAASQVCKG